MTRREIEERAYKAAEKIANLLGFERDEDFFEYSSEYAVSTWYASVNGLTNHVQFKKSRRDISISIIYARMNIGILFRAKGPTKYSNEDEFEFLERHADGGPEAINWENYLTRMTMGEEDVSNKNLTSHE